jgi:hypothetical protein
MQVVDAAEILVLQAYHWKDLTNDDDNNNNSPQYFRGVN